ncbi:MAG: lipid-A-disaccharide synthase [Thermodesulfovibrionia bacterium]|nr:lipid-A-disaccharide synthase [Thermodesulfovibrionia bacterium]
MSKKIMISAGEASGELYGALLSREVKARWPEAEIFGIGGAKMEGEGVKLIAKITNVIGFSEAVKHLGKIRKIFKQAKDALTDRKPDILVLIDYPDFNLALAKKAKSAGIPVLYYVSPQVWAWRAGRVKKIASLADKIAVLFPFEVDHYKGSGLPCEFVGHPISETINIKGTDEEIKSSLGLNPYKPVITLLPGSRPDEINRHMPVINEVAEMLHNELPDFQIIIPLAAGSELPESVKGYITVLRNQTREAVACSDVSLVASGTATLETALLGTPMVVFYIVSPLTYILAKLLVKVKYASLVNILSGKEVVREMIQKDATPDNIFREIKRIIEDKPYKDEIISNLKKVRDVMTGKKPSSRVAAMAGEIAGWKSTSAY